MFSLLGYTLGNGLPVTLLSTYSWRPVVWCCQSDVQWQVRLGQKKISAKEKHIVYNYFRLRCIGLLLRLRTTGLINATHNVNSFMAVMGV